MDDFIQQKLKEKALDDIIQGIHGQDVMPEAQQVAEIDPDQAKMVGAALNQEPQRPLTNYEKQILEQRKNQQNQDGPNVKGFFGALKKQFI